ncbi:DUF1778 domain-containing protein [Achromobacter sp. Root565]|uniref:type II toxin-antitoxin system TacA family antitoxin n=1 Tax=Achromobacter sp. Root565 TaxID=1736564 RepID=UPI0009E7EC41|nr:DUF1778 domain-containing protein [Achromobacter sp. Root565]
MPKYRELRLEITPALHTLLERAAALEGKTLKQFAALALRRAAEAAQPTGDVVHLSKQAQEAFARALLSPDPPNSALKKALLNHKRLFGN